uniref:Uncharacterized protein n=1 Tax=Nonomuraea gerenzanensis TaxID=93944 RepID=A0A1M4E3X5_9ACTN|nr:hypothetical protein BN4615_P3079 [Nonomuraea gerenzanensis]
MLEWRDGGRLIDAPAAEPGCRVSGRVSTVAARYQAAQRSWTP